MTITHRSENGRKRHRKPAEANPSTAPPAPRVPFEQPMSDPPKSEPSSVLPKPDPRVIPYKWPKPFDLGRALTALDRMGVRVERVVAVLGGDVTIGDITDWVQGTATTPPAETLAVYELRLAQLFADAQAWEDLQSAVVGLDDYLESREQERRRS